MPALTIHPDVALALADGRPIVALESTIITHGMSYPANVETARAVEAEVRAGGAVPATIAVLNGRLHVGLGDDDLEALARAVGVHKASRRDLAWLVATGASAGTTVAATMAIAALAGIRVFVTGGLGGVHRGGEVTMDVSADLGELGRTPVAVICAGAKTILDLPRTLEMLETLGVPVIGYGTDRFPAFLVRETDLPVTGRVDDPRTAARLIRAHHALGGGGVVIAVPIPADAALPAAEVEAAVLEALAGAAAAGIAGKDVTPYLLASLERQTSKRTLAANQVLVQHNARVGTAIAVALAAEN